MTRSTSTTAGSPPTVDRDNDKNPVVALREIAEETVRPRELGEALVSSLQRVQIDEEDATDELASLSESAEALRLTRQLTLATDDPEAHGLLRRTHGGAYPVESAGFETTLAARSTRHVPEKRRIAAA